MDGRAVVFGKKLFSEKKMGNFEENCWILRKIEIFREKTEDYQKKTEDFQKKTEDFKKKTQSTGGFYNNCFQKLSLIVNFLAKYAL